MAMAMALDLIVRNARLARATDADPLQDIGIEGGAIVAVAPRLAAHGPEYDARGKLVSPGLIESHFHLDKAMTVERVPYQPDRMARDHMKRTASIKHTFTHEDTYARASATLDQCLLHGVTHMRTQVEVDPNVGLIGFEVVEQLRKDYAWAIDIQPCVFLQEGWTEVPGADENLVACLERGAPVIGGGIRYDKDGPGQIRRVFELAQRYAIDVDFHLDGGHEIDELDHPQVCEITDRIGWQGRVAFGHGSKFSCMPVKQQAEVGKRLARSGVSLAVLPATDLFNGGRHMEHSVMRAVTDANTLIENGANCTLSTNNVLNAFTPYGDCSLTRIANLYANVVQRYGSKDLSACFEMITERAAQLMRLGDYGLEPGKAADLVVWDETSPADSIAKCALPLAGFKRGRRIFTRQSPHLHRPG
ncbi:MAG: amidohydrolase family protein [Betaproteobacteria bacterium]|nr:amidohydrolase family protein [Betaproteobacteria bacterium]